MRRAGARARRTAALVCLLALAACGEEEGGGDAAVDSAEDACRRGLPAPSAPEGRRADLSLHFEDFEYKLVDGRHHYAHVRRFRETAGVPVTIYRGRVCVQDGARCAEACVAYRVPADGALVQDEHHVATSRNADRITVEYWARDDAGHFMKLDRTLRTEGREARVAE